MTRCLFRNLFKVIEFAGEELIQPPIDRLKAKNKAFYCFLFCFFFLVEGGHKNKMSLLVDHYFKRDDILLCTLGGFWLL